MAPAPLARVFSAEDDVRFLESLVDDAERTGTQTSGKVRELRDWYLAKRADGGVRGDDATEARKYALSARIWGAEAEAQPKAGEKRRRAFEEMQRLYPYLSSEVETLSSTDTNGVNEICKMAFEFMGDEQAAEFEAITKKQAIKEFKMDLDRRSLRAKVAGALVELFQSSVSRAIPQ